MRTATLIAVLATFIAAHTDDPNPATTPVPQRGMEQRHAGKAREIGAHKFDLLMVGDSITQNFEKTEYQPIWKQYFEPRNAINLGYSGGRTENTIWNLQNGELEGQTPKVVTLMIGTNNADETNYPTHHTSEQIADGIKAIVKLLREKVPHAKILLLGAFPYGDQPDANSRGKVLIRTNELIKPFADRRHVFFLDIGHVFLNKDGSMNKPVMPDVLHPNPAGALLWAKEMEPLLSKLIGDKPKG